MAAFFVAGCIPSSGGPSIPPIPSSTANDGRALSSPAQAELPKKGKVSTSRLQGENPYVSKSPTAGRKLMPHWNFPSVPEKVYEKIPVGWIECRKN